MINLHTKTSKGSFNSIIKNSDLMGLPSKFIPVIDDTMFNVIDFYKECKANDKRPIIGLEVFESFGKAEDLIQYYGKIYGRLSLVAKDYYGYQNLVRIMTHANKYGYYKKPRIDLETLYEYHGSLFCFIDSISSILTYHIINNNVRAAHEEIKKIKTIFKDNLYCVVYGNAKPDIRVISFMEEHRVPLIASNIVRYINNSDQQYWKYIWHIITNTAMTEQVEYQDFSLCGIEKFIECEWIDSDSIQNVFKLVSQIEDYSLDRKELLIPDMQIKDRDFIESLYQQLVNLDLNSQKYRDRLDYELNTIMQFGYKDYFILVKDVIEYAKNRLSGYISAGRGSVGGCLVAFLMGITRIDPLNPIGFDLEIPFDRFLNSGRKVMPDIDLDFLPRDRSKVIQYLKDKYGDDCVKNMMTVVTFGARSSIREVCRISGTLDTNIELILKSFPTDQQLNLESLKGTEIFIQNSHDPVFMSSYEIATHIEGLARNIGVHASGIALSDKSMDGNVPMFIHNDREVTQYDQDSLDYMGVVKLDILGLNILQIISDCLDMIDFDMDKAKWLNAIPVDDNDIYWFIRNSDITGVFQWDTYNYRKVIDMVRPKNFKELVDLNTLGRSAALLSGLTDKYIKRKDRIEKIDPLHPLLEGLMNQTYELPLYQEQLMSIFVNLAGFSSSESDDVRKAIGKKIPELMTEQKQRFITGCSAKGISKAEADEIWLIIDKFSKYTWNLGHAMAYTRICYETAYLACKYPKEFYSACINNIDSSDDANRFISTLKKRKVQIVNCDINESKENFIVKDGIVYAGFSGLKYFKEKRIKALLELRQMGFDDIKDFCNRVPKKLINKQALESLFCAGAFDKMINIEEDIDIIEDRLGVEVGTLKHIRLDQYKKCGRATMSIGDIMDRIYPVVSNLSSQSSIELPMYVAKIKEIYTKNHKKMAFTVLEDHTGQYEVTWFPDNWKASKLKAKELYMIRLQHKDGLIGLGAVEYSKIIEHEE